ncbi:MAG: hypothetical protein SGPRY_011640, partial [Prymnesium sp.]
ELKRALQGTHLLLGSAPVGPTTVANLQLHAGKLPVVRFGSTETCLQCRPTAEGEPGLLITRGNNLMSGYVGDEEGSREAVVGGWYLKLGDVVFWLEGRGGGRDLYWCTRESALLIRGGANYSYEQINAEIARFVSAEYGLASGEVEVGVVGLRVSSEHEDECCVTLELISEEARAKRALMEESFLATARRNVSKGARPDRVRFAALPRNFKGALQHPLLKEQWKAALEQSS